jgi:hypothetical protein
MIYVETADVKENLLVYLIFLYFLNSIETKKMFMTSVYAPAKCKHFKFIIFWHSKGEK